jgi:CRISPR type III-A-associated protein Csm2
MADTEQDVPQQEQAPEATAETPAEAPVEIPAEHAAEKPAGKPGGRPPGNREGGKPPNGGQQGQAKGGNREAGSANREAGAGNREAGSNRPPRPQGAGGGDRPDRGPRPDRGGERSAGGPGGDRGGPRPNRDRFDGPVEIELEKLMADPLYLDNQAHAVVARMRDMDSGTRSQLRRFYSAVRRACRTADAEKQHEFVMLRARLAYTIARHQLRSLDPLEKLLLQVTRKNDTRGYERFRDLFEAIVAYNE